MVTACGVGLFFMNRDLRKSAPVLNFPHFFTLRLIAEASAVSQADLIDDSESRGFRGSLYCV